LYKSPLQMDEKTEETPNADPTQLPDSSSPVKADPIKIQKAKVIKELKNKFGEAQKDDLSLAAVVTISSVEIEVPMEVEAPPTPHFLDVSVPTAVTSPYHLVYEALNGEPWKVLLASVLVKSVNSVTCQSMVLDFFEKFPTLESIQKDKLVEFFQVGLANLGNDDI
jgi:hypothetical protein